MHFDLCTIDEGLKIVQTLKDHNAVYQCFVDRYSDKLVKNRGRRKKK